MTPNNALAETISWEETFGLKEGVWLQHQFAHVTKELKEISDVRVARTDDEDKMAAYRDQADAGHGESGDWRVTSPETGICYQMGCTWSGGTKPDPSW